MKKNIKLFILNTRQPIMGDVVSETEDYVTLKDTATFQQDEEDKKMLITKYTTVFIKEDAQIEVYKNNILLATSEISEEVLGEYTKFMSGLIIPNPNILLAE